MNLDLEHLAAVNAAATPGPWDAHTQLSIDRFDGADTVYVLTFDPIVTAELIRRAKEGERLRAISAAVYKALEGCGILFGLGQTVGRYPDGDEHAMLASHKAHEMIEQIALAVNEYALAARALLDETPPDHGERSV